MTRALLAVAALAAFTAMPAPAQEADHPIHEELRALLREVEGAMNSGQFDRMLPLLDERIEATSITQEVMASRADVSNYFKEWFGPSGYMKSMKMKLAPDALTELSPDKSWGLVRGGADEHYEAKDGDQFDFKTRWTAVVTRSADDRWRLRAIHFGTNHLDNPVLTKVQRTLRQYAFAAAAIALLAGVLIGVWIGRRGARGRAPGARA